MYFNSFSVMRSVFSPQLSFMLLTDLSFSLPFSLQAKLRYDPIELDPEEMCRMASEKPQVRIVLNLLPGIQTVEIYSTQYLYNLFNLTCAIWFD